MRGRPGLSLVIRKHKNSHSRERTRKSTKPDAFSHCVDEWFLVTCTRGSAWLKNPCLCG